jgi:hypothetical protein
MIVVGIDSMLKVRRMNLAPTGVLFSSFESTPERASTAIDERAAECQETSHAARTHPGPGDGAVQLESSGAARIQRCSSNPAVQLESSGAARIQRCSSNPAVQLRFSGTKAHTCAGIGQAVHSWQADGPCDRFGVAPVATRRWSSEARRPWPSPTAPTSPPTTTFVHHHALALPSLTAAVAVFAVRQQCHPA